MAAIIKKYNQGFTLIEMVVVAGLIGLLSVGVVGIFISTIQGNYRAKLQAEVKEQGDFAITSMERTIRNSPVAPTCSGSTVLFTQKDGTSNQYQYRLNTSTNKIEFSRDTGASWTPIIGEGTNVSGLIFTCTPDASGFTSGKVRIQFTARASNTSGHLDQAFETTVAIRTLSP